MSICNIGQLASMIPGLIRIRLQITRRKNLLRQRFKQQVKIKKLDQLKRDLEIVIFQ